MTFEELYRTMLKQAVEKGSVQADDLEASAGHLDCLLHPQDHPLVWPLNPCTCPKEETHCAAACLFDAIVRRDDGTLAVDPDRCSGCGACIQACQSGNLTAQPGRAACPGRSQACQRARLRPDRPCLPGPILHCGDAGPAALGFQAAGLHRDGGGGPLRGPADVEGGAGV